MRKHVVISLISILLSVCLFVSCRADLFPEDVTDPVAGSTEVVGIPSSKAKVIILSGQSNAAGVSLVATLSETDTAKYASGFEDIMISVTNAVSGHNSDGFVKTTTGWGDNTEGLLFGPEVGLAEELSSSYPGEKIYIIKYSWSGAGLKDKFLPGRTGYRDLCQAIDNGLETLRNQGLDPEVVAFCWMQGESDACFISTTRHYGNNQKTMVNSLRERYGNFFFLDAGISTSWTYYARVNNEKKKADCSLGRCVFINSNYYGLKVSASDPAHYDAPSMIRLGHLFGEQVSLHIETNY